MKAADLHEVCPAQEAWDVVSGKWKPCIIHVLSQRTMRFNELRRSVPGITQRMLTHQLRELERDGIVARYHYAEIPARVEYELTRLGHSILPVFVELTDWWKQNRNKVLLAREGYQAP
jgi:DNA-binding HxlR family transcriptional regulator